ncbi:hypothetical protein EMPS_08224 [Entomortierella parvispora]|uniref:Sds3-like-domain-containing protein n=1 Tax=Entomortierella parvispora TaxID=205924 RepID=A0A9P3LYW5_9FUNG|nr:hypothetical protein EMPS_08224 [Entomortierella parvispora]
MLSSSTTIESRHSISNNHNINKSNNNHSHSSHSSPSISQRTSSPSATSKVHRQPNSKDIKPTSHGKQTGTSTSTKVLSKGSASKNKNHSYEAALAAHSESEDSYTAGGGFISEMDEHDSAFDGAMEYDEEDGRSLLGEDFDGGSDVAVEVQENKKDKRRREFQDRLQKLELEFEENKQTIFQYQMARYKEEMSAILNGVHPDFHDQLEDLAEAREITIANARLYRDYQFECAQQAYRLETELAEEEYMGEREGLREKMLAVIDSKRRVLREDKENLDITNDFALEPTTRAHQTRKLRKRGQEAEIGTKNSKRKTAQPPAAKWLAADSDAMEDLSLIRKVVNTGTTKKSGTLKKK